MAKTTTLKSYLHQAVDLFYKKDVPSLLDKNGELSASERSYVFRIAHYLQGMLSIDENFKDVVVDCEYSRATSDEKDNLEKYMDLLGIYPDNTNKKKDGKRVFPDLVVHSRGNHKNNLMVVEFKGTWNVDNQAWDNDEKKLTAFTNDKPDNKLDNDIKQYFHYKIGIFVMLGQSGAYYVNFKHGQQISKGETIKSLQQKRRVL